MVSNKKAQFFLSNVDFRSLLMVPHRQNEMAFWPFFLYSCVSQIEIRVFLDVFSTNTFCVYNIYCCYPEHWKLVNQQAITVPLPVLAVQLIRCAPLFTDGCL